MSCSFCNQSHKPWSCPKFLNLAIIRRRELAKERRVCFNYLCLNHTVRGCPVKGRCGKCGKAHNSLLHLDSPKSFESRIVDNNNDSEASASEPNAGLASKIVNLGISNAQVDTCQGFNVRLNSNVLLGTAEIMLYSPTGNYVIVKALLDPGAQVSFISSRVMQLLNLESTPSNTQIFGIGNRVSANSSQIVNVVLKSRLSDFSYDLTALVLDRLTALLPDRDVTNFNWPHLQGLMLADQEFYKSSKIDCVLGVDVWAQIMMSGVRKGPIGSPIAVKTLLGWVIFGPTVVSTSCLGTFTQVSCHMGFVESQDPNSIAKLLSRFWEVEDLSTQLPLTPAEQSCLDHFQDTMSRQEDGRFVVRLPFRIQNPIFPGSRNIAFLCWSRTSKKFESVPEFKAAYDKFMNEYLDLGDMQVVPKSEIDIEQVYYIPHHAIFESENNKIRVVFNASQKAFNKVSLNDALHQGPKLQQDLVVIILRWRFFKFVFMADIVKMYRQIYIDSRDRKWLRILYDFGEGVRDFELNTVTYGTNCAPFQALKVMKTIAESIASSHPAIAEILNNQTYMDDVFVGGDSIDQTIDLRDQLISVFKGAQFELAKWAINDDSLLLKNNQSEMFKSLDIFETVSTLGLRWNPLADEFFFTVESKEVGLKPSTKRKVLSSIAKLFDPMGWLAPFLIRPKMLIQDIWVRKLE